MLVTSAEQISDSIDNRTDIPRIAVRITSLLPDPAGTDTGLEQVQLKNTGSVAVDLDGWYLRDRAGRQKSLQGSLSPGEVSVIRLRSGELPLNNTGDEITLMDRHGKVMNAVSYTASDVITGQAIEFA